MLASSPAPPPPHGGVGGGLPAAASVWIRSSGVIGGSDMVPAPQQKFKITIDHRFPQANQSIEYNRRSIICDFYFYWTGAAVNQPIIFFILLFT
jgi:hypothetical protein